MLSKRYESTVVNRRTWLHVPSGTHWSSSSDTHQVVEIPVWESLYRLEALLACSRLSTYKHFSHRKILGYKLIMLND